MEANKSKEEAKMMKRIAKYPRSVEALTYRANQMSDAALLALGVKVNFLGEILADGFISCYRPYAAHGKADGSQRSELSRADYFMTCEAADRTGLWD
jgi:hypothetical protein